MEASHAALQGISEPCSLDDLIVKVGRMVDAKLDGLRSELFHSGARPRPPLAHEEGRNSGDQDRPTGSSATTAATVPVARGQETWAEVVSRKGKAAAKKAAKKPPAVAMQPPTTFGREVKGKKGGSKIPPTVPKKACGSNVPPPAMRGKEKEKSSPLLKQDSRRPQHKSPKKVVTPSDGGAKKGGSTTAGAGRLPRLPRRAAVAVTIPPDSGFTYAQALAMAKDKIDLAGLGIQGVKPKRAVTGGLLLEVPGENSVGRADALAVKMSEVLSPMGVRVSRPVKRAEVRVTDLDESVTPSEVGAALAATTGCMPADYQVGDIRRSPSGLGSAWVRCPLGAARVLAAAGRVRVGWSLARVVALAQRPLQCFQCLETGHVRARCPGVADRSGRCYRCGEAGHPARECRAAAPKCPVCSDLGRPHNHRLGGRGCNPPKKKKVAAGSAASAAAGVSVPPPPVQVSAEAATAPSDRARVIDGQEEAMDAEQ